MNACPTRMYDHLVLIICFELEYLIQNRFTLAISLVRRVETSCGFIYSVKPSNALEQFS